MSEEGVFLNQPIPGESMVSELGKYPFDNPPEITSPVEAMSYVLKSYLADNTSEEILKLVIAGVTLESLVNMIVKTGFMEGIFTVDVAEIIKPALLLHLLADARDAGVEDIRILNDSNVSEISPEDFMSIKNELRGEEVPDMDDMEGMEVLEGLEGLGVPEGMPEGPEMTGSFLDMEIV